MKGYATLKRKLLQDHAIKQAYEALGPEYTLKELIAMIRPENIHEEMAWGKPVGKKYGNEDH